MPGGYMYLRVGIVLIERFDFENCSFAYMVRLS
jgi:hypothetical protein